MRYYTFYKTGSQSRDYATPLLEEQVEKDCFSRDLRTIPQLNELGQLHGCHYSLGSYFLLRLWEVMGEDSLGKALGEIYLHLQEVNRSPTEEEMLSIFLRNVTQDQMEAFQDAYSELHTPLPTQ